MWHAWQYFIPDHWHGEWLPLETTLVQKGVINIATMIAGDNINKEKNIVNSLTEETYMRTDKEVYGRISELLVCLNWLSYQVIQLIWQAGLDVTNYELILICYPEVEFISGETQFGKNRTIQNYYQLCLWRFLIIVNNVGQHWCHKWNETFRNLPQMNCTL